MTGDIPKRCPLPSMTTVFSKEVIAVGKKFPDEGWLKEGWAVGDVGYISNMPLGRFTTISQSHTNPGSINPYYLHSCHSQSRSACLTIDWLIFRTTNFLYKMPKRAKKAWRKNINLDDLYEGIQRTRQELASGYTYEIYSVC